MLQQRILIIRVALIILTLCLGVGHAYAYECTTVEGANCRVRAGVDDSDSCKKLGIDVDSFKIRISNNGWPGTCAMVSSTKSITLGTSEKINGQRFRFSRSGDLGCIYVNPVSFLRVPVNHEAGGRDTNLAWSGSIGENCVYLPPPDIQLEPPSWGGFISPVCTSFNSDDSYHSIPFMSVIVQCIQESMMNIFSVVTTNDVIENVVNQSNEAQQKFDLAKNALTYRQEISRLEAERTNSTTPVADIDDQISSFEAQCDANIYCSDEDNFPSIADLEDNVENLEHDAVRLQDLENQYTSTEGKTSFFMEAQKNLKTALTGLLTLYVIVFGYGFIMKPGGIKNKDFHWFILKMALVLYFASGPGMTNLLPGLQTISRELSEMFLDAAMGRFGGDNVYFTSEEANAAKTLAYDEYEEAREDLRRYRRITHARNVAGVPFADPDPYASEGLCLPDIPPAMEFQVGGEDFERSRCQEQAEVERLYAVVEQKHNVYEKTLIDTSVLAYKYCDFSNESLYPYPGMDLRIWDMVDCRLAKYTGVGEIREAPSEPQLVLIAIASLWSSIWGIIIFLFAVVSIIFIVMVILRVANIYLMAMIGLIMLVYFSPLLIPSVLFNKTRYIFDSWLNQIISYTLQPVILFAFLAVFFAITDHVIYGDNSIFYQPGSPEVVDDPSLLNKLVLSPEGECIDENKLGCIYNKAVFARTDDIGIGDGFVFTTISIVSEKGIIMVVELTKLLFLFFIMHAVLELMEQMASTLTNAAGGGAAGMSGMPKANPLQVFQGAKAATIGATKAAFYTAKGGLLATRSVVKGTLKTGAYIGGAHHRSVKGKEAAKSAKEQFNRDVADKVNAIREGRSAGEGDASSNEAASTNEGTNTSRNAGGSTSAPPALGGGNRRSSSI